jgi:glycosyltransferase involved in cell wall biosynthesis
MPAEKPGADGELPGVSVVVATHNRPELLAVALDRILAQNYEGEIECVVVFDQSSPDPSLENLSSNRPGDHRRIRVIRNDRTAGLAGARNSGVLASSHALIAFCDDDDEWLPGKLSAQVRAMGDPQALTAVTGIIVVYEDRETPRIPQADDLRLSELARRRVMEAHPSTVLVRRDALLGPIGLVDEDIPGSFGEDYDWMLRAARAGPIVVVEEALVRVRWGQSLFSRKWQTIIDALDYLTAKHDVLRADRRGRARLRGQRAFAQAALGRTRPALADAGRAFWWSWGRELRVYVAVAVALRLVRAEKVLSTAHRRGRGI